MPKINYPCVMVEKKDSYQKNDILNHFSIIRDDVQLQEQKKYYTEPVIVSNYDIVREAIKIEKLFKPV